MHRTAAEVMTREIACLSESATVRELLGHMRAHAVTGVPIIDARGRAVGLVSQNDLARALAMSAGHAAGPPGSGTFQTIDETKAQGRNTAVYLVEEALAAGKGALPGLDQLLGRPAREVMTPVVWSCRPDAKLDEVCDLMVQRRIHRVLVCDAGRKVLGMIAALDIVRLLRDELRKPHPA